MLRVVAVEVRGGLGVAVRVTLVRLLLIGRFGFIGLLGLFFPGLIVRLEDLRVLDIPVERDRDQTPGSGIDESRPDVFVLRRSEVTVRRVVQEVALA